MSNSSVKRHQKWSSVNFVLHVVDNFYFWHLYWHLQNTLYFFLANNDIFTLFPVGRVSVADLALKNKVYCRLYLDFILAAGKSFTCSKSFRSIRQVFSCYICDCLRTLHGLHMLILMQLVLCRFVTALSQAKGMI